MYFTPVFDMGLSVCVAVTSHSVAPPGYGNESVYDTSGQLAPPGSKPRVTATLWEDEGSLCFQIEARGVCVARREGMDSSRLCAGDFPCSLRDRIVLISSR